MATRQSQNGWPAYPDTSHFVRVVAHCTGGDFPFWAANADVGVVLKEFIERFDREVEPVTQKTLDDWSWANRLVRGSTSVVSNHGSATAIDINALQHPRGVHRTFTPAKARAVRRIKNELTDNSGVAVLRLGMDYTTVVDDMHVEINTGPRRVREAADKIRKKNLQEDVMAKLDDDDIQKIAKAVWQMQVIKLSPAAALAINSPDVRPGEMVSAQYLLQWPPLVRRTARDQRSSNSEIAEASRLRDAQTQKAIGDIARMLTQIGIGTGQDPRTLAAAVVDQLAERLKS